MTQQKIKDYLPVLSLCNGLLIAFLLSDSYNFLYIALGISFLSILVPKIAYYIGLVTKEMLKFLTMTIFIIVATIFFYLFLTPLGFLKRKSEKNSPFSTKNISSFFIQTNKSYTKEYFDKMG